MRNQYSIKRFVIIHSSNQTLVCYENTSLSTSPQHPLIRPLGTFSPFPEKREIENILDEAKICHVYPVSTGKNGMGEQSGSECTPRGWHAIHAMIGRMHQENSVFVGRQWTQEIYNKELAAQFPVRDWILTRIIQLEGLEPGKNKGGDVDTLSRYIYIHGTPDTTPLGIPGSRGCVRMRNADIIALADWVSEGLCVYIE